MRRIGLAIAAFLFVATGASDATAVSFKGRKITMIIGFAAGGGTDIAGRVFAGFLSRYLPGNPAIVVQNMPGARGITSINYVVQQTRPDGTMIIIGSSGEVDPLQYRSIAVIVNASVFKDRMEGKIRDPVAKKAFDYWIDLNAIDKWLALAPGTPRKIFDAYREAFTKLAADPEFLKQSSAASGVTAVSYEIYEDAARKLDATPPEAISYIDLLLRKQGLQVQK